MDVCFCLQCADVLKQLLIGQLECLEEPYRTIIKQKYFEDKKISEIAAYTGRAEGTVKSDLSRAKRKLKLILEEG